MVFIGQHIPLTNGQILKLEELSFHKYNDEFRFFFFFFLKRDINVFRDCLIE